MTRTSKRYESADCGQSALSPGQLALMTTPATTHDGAITDKIHQALALKELLPSEHLMDTAYVDAQHLVTSRSDYEIELIGPVTPDSSWQAKAQQGFDISCFAVDWEAQTVVCPAGKPSQAWRRRLDDYGNPVIEVRFNRDDCAACTLRQQCTHAKKEPRLLKLRPQKLHQALQAARLRQTTAEFKQRYACASWGRRHPLSRYSRL